MKAIDIKDIVAIIDDAPPVITITVNNLSWDIYLKDQSIFKQRTGVEDCTFFGLTVREKEEVWLWDGIRTKERLYQTIKHELVHVFVDSYGFSQYGGFTEENMADFIESYGDKLLEVSQAVCKAVLKAKKQRT